MDSIIVFGRGKYFKRKEKYIYEHYKVVAFLDNKKCCNHDAEHNIPIYIPKEIRLLPSFPIYIFVSNNNVFDIIKQLLELNVSLERIRFGFFIPPAINAFETFLQQNNIEAYVTDSGICLKYRELEIDITKEDDIAEAIRKLNKAVHPYVEILSSMPIEPVDRDWGNSFGRPIDRYYIEKFLNDNSNYIVGDVAEIADNYYTYKFGSSLSNVYALHVYGIDNTIKCNFATGEGVIENLCDCLICTQTLQFIFDLPSAVDNIYKVLKPGGTALITVPGISQLDTYAHERWGESWRFTKQSLAKIFGDVFGNDNISVSSFGNVKIAVCFLYGLCQEDLCDNDYAVNDDMYPVIVTLLCHKKYNNTFYR